MVEYGASETNMDPNSPIPHILGISFPENKIQHELF